MVGLITFKAKEPINIKYLFSMGAHSSSELYNSTSERLTYNRIQNYAKHPPLLISSQRDTQTKNWWCLVTQRDSPQQLYTIMDR